MLQKCIPTFRSIGLHQAPLAGQYFYPSISNYPGNAVWEINNESYESRSYRAIANLTGDLDLSDILKGLKFRSELGMDELSQLENQFDFRNTEIASSTSTAWDRHTNVLHWTLNNYFTYDFKPDKSQDFNLTLGNSLENSKTEGFGLEGYNFSNDFFTSPGNAASGDQSGYAYATEYSFISYFFRMNYKLLDKYLLSFSIRDDGSSRFGPDNRYGTFPAVSAGWILSEEDFIKKIKPISFLKIRSSYGLTGNANIGDYSWMGVYSSTGGYDNLPGSGPKYFT